jgi:autotransporter-associated beta strand protein
MKLYVKVAAALCALFVRAAVAVTYDADTTVADAITLDGEYEVNVASNVTVTFSGVISGTGPIRKKGAGTLVLSNGGNTFTAGVQISQGYVRADAEGCLGTGTIAIDGTAGKSGCYGYVRQIRFYAANATFDNAITIAGPDPSGYSPDATFISAMKSVTLNGAVTFTVTSSSSCNTGISCGTSSDKTPVLHFTKPVTYSGYLRVVSYGNMIFDDMVTAGTFHIGYNYALTGTVHLNSPSNIIGSIKLAGANISAGDTNVLGGAAYSMGRVDRDDTTRDSLMMNGHDQTLKSLDFSNSYTSHKVHIMSTAPATLKLTGENTSRTSYQTLMANVSLVLDAQNYPSFVQTLSSRAHEMDGILAVSNGTLAAVSGSTFKRAGEVHVGAGGAITVDGTSSGIFAAATNVVIDGTMTLGSNVTSPLTDGIATLALGAGENRLTMADTVVLRVKGLTVGGVRKANGTYGVGGTSLAQLNGGTIVVDDGSAVIADVSWTGGGGASTGIAEAGNWSTSPELPDLTNGTTLATFASGGGAATVDREVSLYGVNLTAPGGFTFADGGNGLLSLRDGSLSAAAPAEGYSPTYRFEVPLLSLLPQAWSVPTGATVQAAGIRDMTAGRIVKMGTGELSVSGASTLAGAFVHSNGVLRLSGTISAPEGLNQGGAVKDGPYSLTVHGEVAGTTVVLDGVTVKKPVWMTGRGDVSSSTVNWLRVAPATTNVFTEPAIFYTNVGYINMDGDSALVFEKGVEFDSTVSLNGGNMTVRGGRMVASTGSGFYMRNGASLRLESPNNSIKFKAISVRLIDLAVDLALTNKTLDVDSGYPTILLHNTVQHVTTLSTTSGVTIEGDYPSRFVIGEGASIRGPTVGNVSFEQRGTGTFTIMMKHHASTGDLLVSKGTLAINADASWRCGTNVFVSGTGTFQMKASGQLNKKIAVVHVDDDGVIDLPDGVYQVVRELRVDGRPAPAGVYGGADAPAAADRRYAAHFSGSGMLRVAFGGFTMTIR